MAEGPEATSEKASPSAGTPPKEYGDRVLELIQWMLTALAAVAATALGKIAFDQLRDGDYAEWRWFLTFLSATAFGIGVVALISGVVATTTVSSVGFSWLMNAKEPTDKAQKVWRWINLTFFGRDPYLAWEVVSALADSKYLVPGATGTTPTAILTSFTGTLSQLVSEQFQNPGGFGQNFDKVDQLTILTSARKNLLEVAKRARLQQVSRQIPSRFLVGTALAILGAVGFGFATSQAKREAAKLDRQVVTGELLPKVPSTVRVLFPAADNSADQKRLSLDGQASCDLKNVDGVLVGVASPSGEPPPPKEHVMHVFTFASDRCRPVEMWLPPERVLLPPPARTPGTEGSSTSSTTTAPSTSTTRR